jgi:vesicle transport through interaction with t-SNAREs protein 1
MLRAQRVFDHYETEYLAISKKAMQDIEYVDQLLPGVEKDETCRRTVASIASAEEIVQSMELEARSLAGDARQQLVAQAKDYKRGIADMRSRLKAAQASSRAEEAARNELLSGSNPTLRREADNQRSRLMQSTERMERGTDKLRGAVALALETEQVGNSILSDLNDQAATLRRTRGTLAGASMGLERSKRLLKGMSRRALANRLMMYVIIFFLFCMICFIIYCARACPPPRQCPHGQPTTPHT